jgi:hypothetical protein
MDFGLSRFLEMFEERFGRRVTTALLAMIGLAIFGLTARVIYSDLLRPLYDFSLELFSFRIFPTRLTPLLAAAASGSAVLIIAAAFYLYSRYRLAQQLKITLEKIELIQKTWTRQVVASLRRQEAFEASQVV